MPTVPPPNVALPQVLAAAAAAPTIVIAPPPPALIGAAPGTVVEAVALPPPPPQPNAVPATPQQPIPPQVAQPTTPPSTGTPPAPNPAPPPAAPSAPTTAPPAAAPTVVLRTALGDLAVRLPIPLPDRARIDLEVVRATPTQVTVRVATVDGQATTSYLYQIRTPVQGGAADPAVLPQSQAPARPQIGPAPLLPGFAWMPSGPTLLAQLGPLSAVITQVPPPAVTPEGLQAPTPTPAPPAAAAPAAPTPAVAATPVSNAPPAPPPIAAPPTNLAALAPTNGSEISLRIVSVQIPGAPVISAPTPVVATPLPTGQSTPAAATVAPPVAVATLPSGPVIAGPQGLPPAPPTPPTSVQNPMPLATVTGVVTSISDGIPTLDVDGHEVRLNVRANVPIGTKVVLDVTLLTPPRTNAALPLPAAALPLSGPPGAVTGWPTLSEALTVLQRSDPVAAQQLAQAIPDGGGRTVAAAVAFVQAMRSGDLRHWPGDTNLRALERAGPRGAHLAGQLSAEVGELASRARDTGGEWRALPIPWNAEGRIERIALITRREGDDEDDRKKERKGGGTRFLIEVNLSQLGPMQMDGMFRTESRTFDLVLRTKATLPDVMRRDLTSLFADTNAAMGLAGTLSFQVTKKFADPLGIGVSPDKSGLWA